MLLLLLLTTTAGAQDSPTFLIESFEVTGASGSAARIVIAESRLREGQTYGEPELRDAMSRIQRLPFVLGTDFRLAKGSSVGTYVLVISVRQMKPLFLNARLSTLWSVHDQLVPTPGGLENRGEIVDQGRAGELAVGGRMFVGAKGMLNVAAQRVEDRNDRYTVAFSQYDLFGTRASVTAVASYLNDPGAGPARRVGVERFDWHHRDNITWELIGVLPVGQHESLRFSWQRSERPIRYLEFEPQRQLTIRSLPEIRKELFWIYDTTNDPLFPTSGTRITAGASRTDTPTSGLILLGRVKVDEYLASMQSSWSVTSSQALTLGGSGRDFDRSIRYYRVFGRYSVDLWGRERTIAAGDLRLELEADRLYTRIKDRNFDAHSTARVGLAWRNVWGVVRLDFAYNAWREP